MEGYIYMTKGDLIVVHWIDTEDDSGWNNIQLIENQKPPVAKHVGWFLNEDEDCIRLLPAIVDSDAGYTIIPKCSIKTIQKIREDELDSRV